MNAAELAAAAEADVLAALATAGDVPVLVEAGHVWHGGRLVADEDAALNLIARGQVREVGTQLQLTAAGHNAYASGGVA
ncbi:hypothetical protein [Catenuloplanes indicus]|uniref:Uncharacterized protein n=1 Tax=Catenuloplanes indicus TaxID=137267 RepID=A0AAE3VSB1_9ACTN|nr:hypothetical protein [Catenuloplanes indicus]MDQ0363343.1 hypothetical protein [Catenuloplanes indicus]MDQ0371665.1 hypothetical protein [Catenuloplanes indicus]